MMPTLTRVSGVLPSFSLSMKERTGEKKVMPLNNHDLHQELLLSVRLIYIIKEYPMKDGTVQNALLADISRSRVL